MPTQKSPPPMDRDERIKLMHRVRKVIVALIGLPAEDRVAAFNAATAALREVVSDLCDDPALGVQVAELARVRANDYNPNAVSPPEMDLLERSIRADGVTMPVVTVRDRAGDAWEVVDGFHRTVVCRDRLGRKYIPVSVIDRPLRDRVAATIRHNRARGKHGVELMGGIVRKLMGLGWDDAAIATEVGMTPEELLRLKQSVGVAPLLAASEYSQSWGEIVGVGGTETETETETETGTETETETGTEAGTETEKPAPSPCQRARKRKGRPT